MVKANKSPIKHPSLTQNKIKTPLQKKIFLVIEDVETMNPNETEDQCFVSNS